MQHRANPHAPGRHRRDTLHSHRAPGTPSLGRRGERGRYAMLTATLVAGVGVASATAASATPTRVDAVAHTSLVAPTPSPSPDQTITPSIATIDHTDVEAGQVPPGVLSFARAERKQRPVPLAQWVNPLPEAAVTSCFGQRWGRLHAGVDLAAPDTTRIRAAGAGVVVAAGPAEGYGNAVLIDHGNGFLTHYGHMSVITVVVGQHVAAGEQIGNEGSTGHSTGPHLHFEVHQGSYHNPIEPTQWMHDHGVDIPGCVTFTKPAPAAG